MTFKVPSGPGMGKLGLPRPHGKSVWPCGVSVATAQLCHGDREQHRPYLNQLAWLCPSNSCGERCGHGPWFAAKF